MFDAIKRKAAAKAMGISDKQMAEMESMKKRMSEMTFRHEEDGIVVKMTGDMKIDYLEIDGESKDDIKKAINKAYDKMQREIAKEMMGSMGGGLSSLLGKM